MKPFAYKLNLSRMGYSELSHIVGWKAYSWKLFRMLPEETTGYGRESFGDELTRLTYDSLPQRVGIASKSYREAIEKLSFFPGFAYSPTSFGMQESHTLIFRHKGGNVSAVISHERSLRDRKEKEATSFSFLTPLADDHLLITTNAPRGMDRPPGFIVVHMPGKSPQQVLERHLNRLEGVDMEPKRIKSDDDLEEMVLNYEHEETEFHLERGVFVKMTKWDIEQGQKPKEEYDQLSQTRTTNKRK
jgi:hypothetical protein